MLKKITFCQTWKKHHKTNCTWNIYIAKHKTIYHEKCFSAYSVVEKKHFSNASWIFGLTKKSWMSKATSKLVYGNIVFFAHNYNRQLRPKFVVPLIISTFFLKGQSIIIRKTFIKTTVVFNLLSCIVQFFDVFILYHVE